MSRPENEFPTINDALAILTDLVKDGFGELPVQIIMTPAGTLQALARHYGPDNKLGLPVGMIEMTPDENGGRIPVCFISSDGLTGTPAPGVQ
jgi:hypothetical protein